MFDIKVLKQIINQIMFDVKIEKQARRRLSSQASGASSSHIRCADHWRGTAGPFFECCFSYVCPEPVLVKCLLLHLNGVSKRPCFACYQRTWLKAEDMQSIAIADMQRYLLAPKQQRIPTLLRIGRLNVSSL